jgi:glucan phosphoethanolaminetransferase (alkaline phosphatase superfamily)
MPLEITLIIIGLLPTIAAWRAWASKDRTSLTGTRKALFAASLALTIYVAFVIYTYRIHGFGSNFAAMLRWARPGLWISLFAVLFVIAGRGRSRLFGLASSLVVFLLWIIPVWGM